MFVLNHDIALEDLGQGISRKVLAHSDNMMSVEVHFETGAIGAMHSHPHEQLTYVLSGEFEFTIGDEKKIVKTGDTMYKEPNIEHGCVCLEAGVLIDTFTPMRKDFV
ncbi:cupin domain-containing protein [Vibrio vulnificus]|uniref:cupin domain-containing protein n=1 Tax=Vibrio vulnificus TaxID=672 RepID=UPI0010290682|nr:cupin domain-containing protein [Vibrio vulnificus]EGQ8021383.1 cupin domain-containing protein [Vibrio vulnificus]EGQ8024666.1 cupin domain-containing protein [Vibrio vulnificus]RZQ78300.1 cupin domain-containing protein [Vibrio vulnificus]RZR02894.1 cupin domain-containing protein [Vibrio vulnificus]RZR52704.1 cupin domain-containing protein [Vibrio vulnificus]